MKRAGGLPFLILILTFFWQVFTEYSKPSATEMQKHQMYVAYKVRQGDFFFFNLECLLCKSFVACFYHDIKQQDCLNESQNIKKLALPEDLNRITPQVA